MSETVSPVDVAAEVAAINAVIDDFHAAASVADEERYFGHLSSQAIYFGTDPDERWAGQEYRDFVHPYFSRGHGWTYKPFGRHVVVAADGRTAWFNETLDNASYGECRGTGVLQRYDGEWKIEQYSLSYPIPNDVFSDVTEKVLAYKTADQSP
jgi:ketosteroid isomerase-like protein